MTGNKGIFALNENGVCNLPDKTIMNIIIKRLVTNAIIMKGENGDDIKYVKGKRIGGQELSRVFRFELRNNKRKINTILFAKLCPIFKSMNPAILEYETLEHLHKKISERTSYFHIAKPIAFYEDLNGYVMESVGNRTFKRFLLKNNTKKIINRRKHELVSITEMCAKWLATFHDLTLSDQSLKFDINDYVNSVCNDEFDYRLLNSFGFSKNIVKRIDQLFRSLSKMDLKYEMPCAKWHWDFTPAHVYLDHGRISVIDIAGIENMPIYDDIGHFLASMSTVNNMPYYPFFDYTYVREKLCDIFIDAYQKEADYEKVQFQLFVNIFRLKKLIIWFFAQYKRMSSKTNKAIGKTYARYKLKPVYEANFDDAINEICSALNCKII